MFKLRKVDNWGRQIFPLKIRFETKVLPYTYPKFPRPHILRLIIAESWKDEHYLKCYTIYSNWNHLHLVHTYVRAAVNNCKPSDTGDSFREVLQYLNAQYKSVLLLWKRWFLKRFLETLSPKRFKKNKKKNKQEQIFEVIKVDTGTTGSLRRTFLVAPVRGTRDASFRKAT